MKSLLAVIGMTLLSFIFPLILLITARLFAEVRYLPSDSMCPSLERNSRVIVEKISDYLKKPHVRGEIVVFYPPPIELGGHDLSQDPLTILGRLTGLPFLPYEPAFIKRVVGLPGDHIRILANQGVFINGQLLDESSYVKEPPNYNLNILGDIGGRASDGSVVRPYDDPAKIHEQIVVPPGHLFTLGDNRNLSEDSHVWGFLDEKRVIGRVQMEFRVVRPPKYQQILDE